MYTLAGRRCTFKLPRKDYLTYFMADLVVFYLVPLVVTCVLYALIARTLYGGGSGGGVGDGGDATRTLAGIGRGSGGTLPTHSQVLGGRGGSMTLCLRGLDIKISTHFLI